MHEECSKHLSLGHGLRQRGHLHEVRSRAHDRAERGPSRRRSQTGEVFVGRTLGDPVVEPDATGSGGSRAGTNARPARCGVVRAARASHVAVEEAELVDGRATRAVWRAASPSGPRNQCGRPACRSPAWVARRDRSGRRSRDGALEHVLADAVADLLLARHGHRQLHELVIEERNPGLDRVGHRQLVDPHQQQLGQAEAQILVDQRGRARRERRPARRPRRSRPRPRAGRVPVETGERSAGVVTRSRPCS